MKPKILIVEDNIIAQTVIRTLITSLSCDSDVAMTGQEALELFQANHYDLIFMDIGLGEGMNGYQVTAIIRTLESPGQRTPIIALTAHTNDDCREQCIESGMDGMFTKPLTLSLATEILNQFIPDKGAIGGSMKADPEHQKLFQLEQFSLFHYKEAFNNCSREVNILTDMLRLMVEEQIPINLQLMRDAMTNGDFPQIAKIAHQIKSSALYLGANRMRYACQYLENHHQTGEKDLVEGLYLQAVEVIKETMDHIKEWLMLHK
ncbi:MAG: response regulator [Legionella sp.]|nr:response regulator [Legionella sp.]